MSSEADLSFIETQFPVSKLSKESYKERKANYSQTLTGLGKWWGRKPLILVRAAILGLLLPASADPRRDRAIFLKLLTMDPEGLWRRKTKAIALADLYERLTPAERAAWFDPDAAKPRYRAGTRAEDKARLQRLVFERLGYDERLVYCDRPEQIDGPSQAAWAEINAHLGTDAASLPDLVRQLGQRRFGHTPRVGDAFCGGGSVPFEAARIGCDAYGSDLNPVAALLTWGALNIVGGGEAVAAQVREAQEAVFAAVDRQVTDWRIEHNDLGWRADAYLYCTETRCPECGWLVPLAPSWVIGEKTMTMARLVEQPTPLPSPPPQGGRGQDGGATTLQANLQPTPSPWMGEGWGGGSFKIEIHQGVTSQALAAAKTGTVRSSRLECPHCRQSTPMTAIRGDRRGGDYGLRQWENADLVPRPDDTFQERLYCIRWRLPDLASLLWAEQQERAGGPCTRPVPEWVPLDRAIAGLAELMDGSDRLDLAELRARDWLAEDAELAGAQARLADLTAAKAPKARLDEAHRDLVGLRARQAQRAADLKALADRLPGALYRGVGPDDLDRESLVLDLLRERFDAWQATGYIPSRAIVPGDKTDEPMRTRGWTHWHHLFTPRQLLIHGLLSRGSAETENEAVERAGCLFALARCADWDSKLCRWDSMRRTRKSPRHSAIRH